MSLVKEFPLEDEYKKDTGIRTEDIRTLREWVDTQPHLPKDHITELDLILTYHSCHRSMQVSKQLLDLHFTLRTLFDCFFKDRTKEPLDDVMLLTPLRGRTKEGYAIFFGRLMDFDPKNMEYAAILKHILMILELWQYEEGTWPGLVFVFDLHGMKLGHLAKMDIKVLQQFMYYLQEAMLLKMKSIHLINAPPFMDKLTALFKMFIKTELLDILVVHEVGATMLQEYIPLELLPNELGGKAGTMQEFRDDIIAKLRASKQYFDEESKKRVVESQRAGKPKTISDIFRGVDGSFKKLDID